MKTKRTARKDSTFILYEVVASDGNNYIGLTRKGSTTVARAVAERWRKHKSRARNANYDWALHVHLRNGGLDMQWEHKIIAIVRGRAEAYAQERVVVKEQRPTLNTQYT